MWSACGLIRDLNRLVGSRNGNRPSWATRDYDSGILGQITMSVLFQHLELEIGESILWAKELELFRSRGWLVADSSLRTSELCFDLCNTNESSVHRDGRFHSRHLSS
jgi:hypothetical protein